jgi:hypothetical protein
MTTLPCFSSAERIAAHRYLASQVASMMGRKFEEGDWAKVYCAAKNIPAMTWSNLSIDVMHGHLGVEHKMLCYRSDQPIRTACGTTQMHPAGTRAIRIPRENDPTKAAQEVLRQYAELLRRRAEVVRILDRYHHKVIDRAEAMTALMKLFSGMKKTAAANAIPAKPSPVRSEYVETEPDMRTGWLLWQESLREFLYFEERTQIPNPDDYYAEWVDSGGGRRKASRNLWVYHRRTKVKHFSITTEAGAKIQPYFTFPAPDDPNLYHFIVQGEINDAGLVRVWLTPTTASFLKHLIGSLETAALSEAIKQAASKVSVEETPAESFGETAIPVLVTPQDYSLLHARFKGVSDEHLIQQMIRALQNEVNDAGAGPANSPNTERS